MPPISFRIQAAAAAGLVLAGSLAAASAQSALRTQPSQKEKQKLAAQIASEGLNCRWLAWSTMPERTTAAG